MESFDGYIQLRQHGAARLEIEDYNELLEILNSLIHQGVLKGSIVQDKQVKINQNLYHVMCADVPVGDNGLDPEGQALHEQISHSHQEDIDGSISVWDMSEHEGCSTAALPSNELDMISTHIPNGTIENDSEHDEYSWGSGFFQKLATSFSSSMFPNR